MYLRLFIYVLLLINQAQQQEVTAKKVQAEQLQNIIQKESKFLVFFYLTWCQYSSKEFDVIKKYLKSETGLAQNIPIYLIDLQDKKEFMSNNEINHVPLLYFYKNGVGVMFEKEMNDENLVDFITTALNREPIRQIFNDEEMSEFINKTYFIYVGTN